MNLINNWHLLRFKCNVKNEVQYLFDCEGSSCEKISDSLCRCGDQCPMGDERAGCVALVYEKKQSEKSHQKLRVSSHRNNRAGLCDKPKHTVVLTSCDLLQMLHAKKLIFFTASVLLCIFDTRYTFIIFHLRKNANGMKRHLRVSESKPFKKYIESTIDPTIRKGQCVLVDHVVNPSK